MDAVVTDMFELPRQQETFPPLSSSPTRHQQLQSPIFNRDLPLQALQSEFFLHSTMFRGSPPNPYDEVIIKATDEAQTSENWSVFIEVCDKVMTDTSNSGPRDCIASIQKRLQHRNANVQLFCLTLTESLVKNTNENLHKEVSSRSFMKVLTGLVLDRYTHEKVKKRILQCLKSWSDDFHGNVNLGLVEETMEELRSKGHRYEEDPEPAHHPPDDILKREEEELQRALAESEREAEWMNMAGVGNFPASTLTNQSPIGPTGYVPASVLNNISAQQNFAAPSKSQLPVLSTVSGPVTQTIANHSVPLDELSRVSLNDPQPPHPDHVSLHPPGGAELYPMRTKSKPAPRRVKALYDFEPSEEGELAFTEGDLIRVIDSAYKDWWKGELRGQIGIFPVNYVEPISDPSPEALAREAEAEAAVFAQAYEIDRLLQMMRNLDAKRDNLADNDELSELYQQTLSLRPKIVRLIEKYTQKKAELLQINAKFMSAKTTYDTMLEESLAKHHTGTGGPLQSNLSFMPPSQPPHHMYGSPSPYPQSSYGYEQGSYLAGPPRLPQSYQHPAIPSAASPRHQSYQPAVAGAGPSHRPHYPIQQQDTTIPEGIDTSRYYLASDGNWYAYSAEQLAANAAGASQNNQVTSAVGGASTIPTIHLGVPAHESPTPIIHHSQPTLATEDTAQAPGPGGLAPGVPPPSIAGPSINTWSGHAPHSSTTQYNGLPVPSPNA